jgi:hypothetical protein
MDEWWFQEDPSYDPEKYGIEWLTRLHKLYNEHKSEFKGNPVHLFFSAALEPYYCVLCEPGATRTVLDLLYRLSDRIEEDERRSIMIYPENDGEIYDAEGDCRWVSLEEWRKENFKQRRGGPIPELRKLIETNKGLEEIIS